MSFMIFIKTVYINNFKYKNDLAVILFYKAGCKHLSNLSKLKKKNVLYKFIFIQLSFNIETLLQYERHSYSFYFCNLHLHSCLWG